MSEKELSEKQKYERWKNNPVDYCEICLEFSVNCECEECKGCENCCECEGVEW